MKRRARNDKKENAEKNRSQNVLFNPILIFSTLVTNRFAMNQLY